MNWVFQVLLVSIFLTLPTLSARASDQIECGERSEMGSPFKMCVSIRRDEVQAARADIAFALSEIKQINTWMSDWIPDSEVSHVNDAAGKNPVKVSPALINALKRTLIVSRESMGALDPTFNVMRGLYNFHKGEEREPTDQEIKERISLIDWKSIVINEKNSTIFLKKKGMRFGLGAVGQSYAADRAVEILKSKGYTGGYVDGSGDTIFWGTKPGGALWTTGVRDPMNTEKVLLRIYGTDFAVTTCGDDEQFFMKDGRRVHHVIDPKTGRSATKSRQITVISKHGFDADAWDTASFVLGPEVAKPILERLGYRAVMVDAKGKMTLTKGLKKETTKWGEGYVVEGVLK
ncbi:FAD:protein FMN transferase [soil metagenome]